MPAYFTVSFSLRDDPNQVRLFYQALEQSGLRYQSGFWHSEGDTLEEIVQWNAAKLRNHDVPGIKEEYTQHYKQALFRFGDFSEARVYLFFPAQTDEFAFHLILPEDDFFDADQTRRTDRMEQIKELMLQMWSAMDLLSVQTCWECSQLPISAAKLERGCQPMTEPYAIVPTRFVKTKWDCDRREICRGGTLLTDENNWNATC